MADGDRFKVKAKFVRQLYPKDHPINNDWGICLFKLVELIDGDDIEVDRTGNFKAVGVFPALEHGIEYMMMGQEGTHPKFGHQYQVSTCVGIIDTSCAESVNDFVKQILTDKEAESLIGHFGDNLGGVLENGDINLLSQVKGIGQKTASKILSKFSDRKDNMRAYIELGALGFSNNTIERLCSKHGGADTLLGKFQANPYFLIGEDGFGFKRADEMALLYGVDPYSVNRVKAYLEYMLQQAGNNGDSYVTTDDVVFNLEETFSNDLPQDVIYKAKQDLIEEGKLWVNSTGELVALKSNYWLEYNIMKELVRINSAPNNFKCDNWEEVVKQVEEEQGFEFTEEQRLGIQKGLECQVNVIIGKAGVGKSAMVKGCLAPLKKYDFSCCALSGRAGANLSEYTGEEGYTIHRLLGSNPMEETGFTYHKGNPLDLDGVVLDEAGMADAQIFYKLIQAVPTGAKLFILGDIGQLESIGIGNILKDMIESGMFNVVELTKIHRQAQKSAIITESGKVYDGEQIVENTQNGVETRGELQDLTLDIYADNDRELTFTKTMKHFKEQSKIYKNIMDIQVIVPMKERGSTSCKKLNKAIQEYLMEDRVKKALGGKIPHITRGKMSKNEDGTVDTSGVTKIYVGDKIINLKNCYETEDVNGRKVPIFNGNVGIVEEVSEKLDDNGKVIGRKVVVDFGETIGHIVLDTDDKIDCIDLAYAITTHKSQGGGYPCVICGLDFGAYKMLTKEMLYTMLTRAKKYCILVGERKAIRHACRTSGIRDRNTFLCNMLKQFYKTTEEKIKSDSNYTVRKLGYSNEKVDKSETVDLEQEVVTVEYEELLNENDNEIQRER